MRKKILIKEEIVPVWVNGKTKTPISEPKVLSLELM